MSLDEYIIDSSDFKVIFVRKQDKNVKMADEENNLLPGDRIQRNSFDFSLECEYVGTRGTSGPLWIANKNYSF